MFVAQPGGEPGTGLCWQWMMLSCGIASSAAVWAVLRCACQRVLGTCWQVPDGSRVLQKMGYSQGRFEVTI